MKFIYPAVFRKNEEGRYKAFFPDLACCEAEGDTLDDAIDNANEAAYNWIYAEVMEDEMDLPAISDESDLDLLEQKAQVRWSVCYGSAVALWGSYWAFEHMEMLVCSQCAGQGQ